MIKSKIITVTMAWNEPHQKWLMTTVKDEVFIYDFWDCGNMRLAFEELNKKKPQKYKLTIEHLED